jgi:SAM-dependent methyltransferase
LLDYTGLPAHDTFPTKTRSPVVRLCPGMTGRLPLPEPCALCGASDWSDAAVVRDNRTGSFAESFTYLRCRRCALVSLHPLPDLEESLSDHERGYAGVIAAPGPRLSPQLGEGRWWQHRLKRAWHQLDGMPAVDRLPVEGRVLDVGAGTGEQVAELLQLGYEAFGLEPNAQAVAIARSRGRPVHHGTAEAPPFGDATFDTVILSQVLEHLVDPVAAVASLRRLLRPGGRLIVLTPNVYGLPQRLFGREWAHWHPPYHVHLFGRRQIRSAIARAGYRVEQVTTLTPSFWLNMSVQLRRRRSQRTGWVLPPGTWQPPHAVRLLLAPVTRTMDALGVGDCLVAVCSRGADE